MHRKQSESIGSSTTTGGFDISYGNIYTTTQSHDHPVKESTVLKTRVSDLEVINILNKSQVGEQDQKATQSKQQLRQVLEKAQQEKYELKGAGGVDQPIVLRQVLEKVQQEKDELKPQVEEWSKTIA
ncbi:MAG: hypothetical protein Q9203_005799 [Teloschistes exilis]